MHQVIIMKNDNPVIFFNFNDANQASLFYDMINDKQIYINNDDNSVRIILQQVDPDGSITIFSQKDVAPFKY